MKRLLTALLVTAAAFTVQGQHKQNLKIWFDKPMSLEGRESWYNPTSDKQWENASLPIGNGSIGANITGSVAAERLTLNEKTLWQGGPNTKGGPAHYWNVNKESAHLLPEIRKAFEEGNQKKAEELTKKNFNGLADYEPGREPEFRFGCFTSLGEAYIETGLSEIGMKNYHRTLSLDSAMVTVGFDKDGVNYERDYFASFPDSVMVIRFSADKPGMQNLVFSYGNNPEAEGEIKSDSENSLLYVGQLKNNNMKFALRIKAINTGGTLISKDGKIHVKGADNVTFLVTADTDYKLNFDPNFDKADTYVGVNPVASTEKMMNQASRLSYSKLLERHYKDYSSLFERVQLELNPYFPMTLQYPALTDLPTYKRLKLYREGKADYQLEKLYYQFGRYLLIASSRPGNLPANLQGMWSNGVDGPWHVDYHNNINLQMNYWPSCMTNLEECTLPLIDFINTLIKPGAKTAKAYFGARGWTASISGNIFGFTSPLTDENMSWNFNPMAGPWLATHVWDYYDYTRDRNFLKNRGYDIIKSSADFTVDYLWKRPDGKYTASPSTSPEHGPVDEGATFVHAVAREILIDAIKAAKVLGVDTKKQKRWKEVLDNLVPYKTGRYGQLMEWSTDIDDPKDEHRHVNHLFGLHPGQTISPVTTPDLAKASRIVLEHRGDGATGWSMGWKLNQWARLHDGNHAYKLYGNLLKNGTNDNLWDTHPPFQIDGNFGGTAGVTEMLLQSHMGFIDLLPALPDAWKDGEVKGLMARGNFEVSMKWGNNKLIEANIISKSGEKCNIRYGDETVSFNTKKGKAYKIFVEERKEHDKVTGRKLSFSPYQ